MRDRSLTLMEHLQELRRRLVICALAIAVCTVVAFVYHKNILQVLMYPAHGFPNVPTQKPVYTEMTEMIGISMKVSLLGGFILALPVVAYQLVMFVAPGLTPKERRYIYIFVPGVMLSFVAGVLFGYFVLFPPSLKFLLTFDTEVATPLIRIGNYINLVVTLLFWTGMVFEIPIVMFFLSRLGIVLPAVFSRFRRHAFLLAFVLGAIITPTFDPVNQTLVAVPIMVLYEAGIWLAKLARAGRAKQAKQAEEAPGAT